MKNNLSTIFVVLLFFCHYSLCAQNPFYLNASWDLNNTLAIGGQTGYLSLENVNPAPCDQLLGAFRLEITASISDANNIYKYGSSPSGNASFTINPELFSPVTSLTYQIGTDLNNNSISNIPVALTNLNPSFFFSVKIDELTQTVNSSPNVNVLDLLRISLGNDPQYALRFNITSQNVVGFNPEDIKINYKIVPLRVIGIESGLFASPGPYNAIQNSVTSKVDFTTECGCPLYQIQVLKLYNYENSSAYANCPVTPTGYKIKSDVNKINWNDAFNYYTTKVNFSLTLAEGSGYYAWRVRKILTSNSTSEADPKNWTAWNGSALISAATSLFDVDQAVDNSDPFIFYFDQFDDNKNWYYTRTLIENEVNGDYGPKENLIGESITYANGLGMVRQTQAFSNANNEILVSNEFQDFLGRSTIKTLAASINQPYLGYVNGFSGTTFNASNFDDNSATYKDPEPMGGPLNQYYSDLNQEADIPNADGYAYTRTRFARNPLGEVVETSLAGNTHKIQSNTSEVHTNRTYTASVADIELVRIFGDEAPPDNKVFKRITIDPNNSKNITYIDKEGKTLATCLAIPTANNLTALASADNCSFQVDYVLNTPSSGTNCIMDRRVVDVSEDATVFSMSYQITPKQYQDLCASLCSTCDYSIEFSICSEEDLDNPVWKAYVHIDPSLLSCSQTLSLPSCPFVDINNIPVACTKTLDKGKYVIIKKVKLHNIDINTLPGSNTYLENNLVTLDNQLDGIYRNTNSTIKNWLLFDGLTNTPILDANNIPVRLNLKTLQDKIKNEEMFGSGGVYEMLYVPVNSTTSYARILKLDGAAHPNCNAEMTLNVQACYAPDCSNMTTFADDLYTLFKNELLNGTFYTTPPSTEPSDYFKLYNALFSTLSSASSETNAPNDYFISYTKAEMQKVLENMMNDPETGMNYTCTEIYKAWNTAVNSVIGFYKFDNSTMPQQASTITLRPNFMDEFLRALGYKFTCGTAYAGNVSAGASFSRGYKSTPYRCYYFLSDNTSPTLTSFAANYFANNSFSQSAGSIIYYNIQYNQNLPSGCSAKGVHALQNLSAVTLNYANCFQANFQTDPNAPVSIVCPYSLTDLIAMYKSIMYVQNGTIQSAITLPNPANEDQVRAIANDMEDQCKKACGARKAHITSMVESELLAYSGVYFPSISIETRNYTYLNNPASSYNPGQFQYKDILVAQVLENCTSKCSLRVENAGGNPAVFKINSDDLAELTKAMNWYVQAKFKYVADYTGLPSQAFSPTIFSISGNNIVPFTGVNPILDAPFNTISIANSPLVTKKYNSIAGMFYCNCRKFTGSPNNGYTKSITDYYIEDSDPFYSPKRFPGLSPSSYPDYAQVVRVNSDLIQSATANLIPFLNQRLNNRLSQAYSDMDIYDDIITYLSPVHYFNNNWSQAIPSKVSGGDQISSTISNQNTHHLVLGTTNTKQYFSLGKPVYSKYTAGNYIIEREERRELPFLASMQVKVKITRTSGAPSLPTNGEEVVFNETLLSYSANPPFIQFETDRNFKFVGNNQLLEFRKTFLFNSDVMEFDYFVRVKDDFHTVGASNLTNQSILDALLASNAANLIVANTTHIQYANSTIQILNPSNGSVISSPAITYNGAPSDYNSSIYPLVAASKHFIVLPGLRNTDISAAPDAQTPDTLSDPDYITNYIFNPTNLASPFTVQNTVNYNDHVQVLPLYLNYTDANGIKHSDFVMNLSNFKAAWHNLFCVQWSPYDPEEALEIQEYSCDKLAAFNLNAQIEQGLQNFKELSKTKLKDAYTQQCELPDMLDDEFKVSYSLGYHHYTLYYYNRAGNLVRTVPPSGVSLLTVNPDRSQHPLHTMVTEYNYNSLNQVTSQKTPDGGVTTFYYDRLGRVRYSRNAQQIVDGDYSFTHYDNLGRIYKSGKIHTGVALENYVNTPGFPSVIANPNTPEYVQTVYTNPFTDNNNNILYYPGTNNTQRNLLNRVSYTSAIAIGTNNATVHNVYSYDINGNVEWMATIINDVPPVFVRYEYDLVSGAVTKVVVNEFYEDAWYHKYIYNTDKKLQSVFTSKNGKLWERDADYSYFKHGPLRNVTIGKDALQKVDYAYTTNGWLKGINHVSLNETHGPNDLFASKYQYFNGDFHHNTSGFNSDDSYGLSQGSEELFNGNIPAILNAMHNPSLGSTNYYAQTYHYDELNRILKASYFPSTGGALINNQIPTNKLSEEFSYDANGNIQTLQRYDKDEHKFDELVYNYSTGKNQLHKVRDNVQLTGMPADFDIKQGQQSNNYVYDAIGNLIQDVQEGLNVQWNTFGKVKTIIKANKTITYLYDASGNRVAKTTKTGSSFFPQEEEYYIRDASGNILTQYKRLNTQVGAAINSQMQTTEQPIYGSDRLGIHVSGYEFGNNGNGAIVRTPLTPLGTPLFFYRQLNNKRYELKDHLGNVRSIFSDVLQADRSATAPYTFNNVHAQATAMYNYFAFGSPKPNEYDINGNTVSHTMWYESNDYTASMAGTEFKYRFGFNGQEKDNEIKGTGNSLDFGARIYDSRLGRWLSLDPLQKKYPELSPYSFAANGPLRNKEVDGRYWITFQSCESYNSSEHKSHHGYYTMVSGAQLKTTYASSLRCVNLATAVPFAPEVSWSATALKLTMALQDNSINFGASDWAGVFLNLVGAGVSKAAKDFKVIGAMYDLTNTTIGLTQEFLTEFKKTDYYGLMLDARAVEILKSEGKIDENGNFSQELIQQFHDEGIKESKNKNSSFSRKMRYGLYFGLTEIGFPEAWTKKRITETVEAAKNRAAAELEEAAKKNAEKTNKETGNGG